MKREKTKNVEGGKKPLIEKLMIVIIDRINFATRIAEPFDSRTHTYTQHNTHKYDNKQ